MKVKITGTKTGVEWYRNQIGEVFEVYENTVFEEKVYTLEPNGKGPYISKCNCEIVPEKYTYADVDLPEWWDGRPIKGYYGDNKIGWMIGYIHNEEDGERYVVKESSNINCVDWDIFENFEPITEKTTAKVSITRNGETTEVELTDGQIKELGL